MELVDSFLQLQPWLVPISSSTETQLLLSIEFYTILCDTSCHIFYQHCPIDRYLLQSNSSLISSPHNVPRHSNQKESISFDDRNEQLNHEMKSTSGSISATHPPPTPIERDCPSHSTHLNLLPIELMIGVPRSSSNSHSSTPASSPLTPSLFLKINSQLYFANHLAIQELTFPKEFNPNKLYIIMKWSTFTLYIYVPNGGGGAETGEYSSDIIYEKLFSAILSMNKILKCSLSSYDEIYSQYQEYYQHRSARKHENYKQKHHPHGDSSTDASSTTIGALSSSPAEIQPTDIAPALDLIINNQSYQFALDCMKSSLMSWMDLHSTFQHLLQPILPLQTYEALISSSPPLLFPDNHSNSHKVSDKKRARPSSPPSSSHSPTYEPAPKQSKLDHPLTPSCLLSLPYDITNPYANHFSTPHPWLNSCLNTCSCSLLSVEESENYEKILYHTLDSVETAILSSYSTYFASNRTAATVQHPSSPGLQYYEELERIFNSSYRHLIEDITTLRVLPRDDRRPIHPFERKK